jgi:hypothetical protein
MFRYFLPLLLALTLIGCSSSSKTKAVASAEASSGTDKYIANTSEPTTFEEYKKWRKAYDPSGQTYADYKEWEAAYKQWKQEQAPSVNPKVKP